MKVLLLGYNWIGCRVLEYLLERNDLSDLFVYTHHAPEHVPDLGDLAASHRVSVSLDDVSKCNLPFRPDFVFSVFYRFIVKAHVISACDGRIFNVHPSLLPRHRGCSSVPWSIIEGDSVTGVTFHYIDEGVDTGRIILQAATALRPDETQQSLYGRLMELGFLYWPAAFELVRQGFPGVPQEPGGCYHRRGVPHGGNIEDAWSDDYIERFIRAMLYPPLPAASYNGETVLTFADFKRSRKGATEAIGFDPTER